MVKRIHVHSNSEALIDDADFDKVSKYRWVLGNGGYPQAWLNGRRIYMHRIIMGDAIRASASGASVVDHINRNPLDNRRKNLRIATRSQNVVNRSLPKANKYGYRGVDYNRNHQSFYAVIYANNKRYKKWPYATAEEAAHAYDELAREHHGDFAQLNFPNTKDKSP